MTRVVLAPFEEPNSHRCFGGQFSIDGIELGVHAGRDSIRENGRLLIGNVFICDLHQVCVCNEREQSRRSLRSLIRCGLLSCFSFIVINQSKTKHRNFLCPLSCADDVSFVFFFRWSVHTSSWSCRRDVDRVLRQRTSVDLCQRAATPTTSDLCQ